MVEGARLESVYTGNRIEGSNPSPSAISIPRGFLAPGYTDNECVDMRTLDTTIIWVWTEA